MATAPASASETRPLLAACLMLAAVTCFATMSVLVRHISADMHPFEIAFFRNTIGAMIMVPLIVSRGGIGALRTGRPWLLGLRGVLNVASMMTWFLAVTLMPLADLTALSFTAPLWGTILAAVVLGEMVRARRWIATAIGFAGALLILRPGFQDLNAGALFVLFSSATWAMTVIAVRILTRTESSQTIVTYQAAVMAPISLVPALFVWEWPSWETLAWLVLLGGIATIGHFLHAKACSLQELTALLPIDFAKLPTITILAFLAFGEVPDIWVLPGALVIFGAAMYVSHREAQLRKQQATVTAPTPSSPPAAPERGVSG